MTEPGGYSTETSDMLGVHQALLGALASAPSLVERAGGAPDRAEVVGSFFENVLEFLHVHHVSEDQIVYPVLKDRCTEQKVLLEQVEAQHRLLDQPMADARAAVAAWRAAPTPDNATALVERLGSVEKILRPHLADEEKDVLPVASAWMSPEEWGQLPGHALGSFQADKPWLALGLVLEQLSSEARAGVLSGMPPQLQTVWAEEWEPAFTAFVADVRS